MSSRVRLRKGEGEQLRREILDATRELLADLGSMELVSIRSIAHRVGVSSPSIYLHFRDKDHLLYEVCREVFEDFAARLIPLFSAEGTALERLRMLGREYIRWGLEHAPLYPVLFLGEPPASIEAEELKGDPGIVVLEGLVALVRSGIEEGTILPGRSPEAIAWAMWSGAHGAVLLLTSSLPWIEEHLTASDVEMDLPNTDELIETVIDALSRSFAAQPA
ncbi:MAG TPA: TetR/AcrR family transcriptional regulator [Acidimicrobiia bacterium]|nr:TetR/AcrR family transcriptional regulator [Acidimicrobiia bacterium]